MQITCRRQEASRFKELGFRIDGEDGSTVTMVDEEANYAHYGELPEDIPWTGQHGSGGNYGSAELACDGKEIAEIEVGEQGGVVVHLLDDDTVDPNSLKSVKQFRAIEKRAGALLTAASQVVENAS